MTTHITPTEAAKILGYKSAVSIRSLIKAGELEAIRIRRKWLIPKTEIDRILTEGISP